MKIQFRSQDSKHLITGPAGDLELVLRQGGEGRVPGRIAVVCHPHPLHGGTMDNKVVTTLARTYRDLGIDTVRFNFRGVGNSAGEHGHLQGEIEDLQAVVALLREEFALTSLYLAGFSFGSAVVARASGAITEIRHLLLVAPPVGKYDLSFPARFGCRTLVLQGVEDEIVDIEQTRRWAETCVDDNFVYREFAETGHFFHGRLSLLSEALTKDLQPLLKEVSA